MTIEAKLHAVRSYFIFMEKRGHKVSKLLEYITEIENEVEDLQSWKPSSHGAAFELCAKMVLSDFDNLDFIIKDLAKQSLDEMCIKRAENWTPYTEENVHVRNQDVKNLADKIKKAVTDTVNQLIQK